MLPAGWRWVKLDDICSQITDGAHKTPLYVNRGVRFISIANLRPFKPLTYIRYEKFITQDEHEKLTTRCKPEKDDILVTKIGTLGIAKKVDFDEEVSIFVGLALAKPNKEFVYPEYLECYLNSPYAKKLAIEGAKGGGRQTLAIQALKRFPVPLPPLPEQKSIAMRLNKQIAAAEKVYKFAEEQIEIARELPSVYLRSIFNDRQTKKWNRRLLGEVCKIIARQVDPKKPEYGILPHVNGENIESGTCQLLYLNSAADEGMKSGKYLFDAGDVLYSKLRPYLKKVTVVDFVGVCSADMYPIKVNHEVLDAQYLSWVLVSDEFTNYADEESRRARMPKLNREQLFAWNAPIPPLDEQKQIALFLNKKIIHTKNLICQIETQLAEINQLTPTLLRHAFSGVI